MTSRVEAELEILRAWYPNLQIEESGLWVLVPDYGVDPVMWKRPTVEVACQIPEALPGQQPYGFYVRPNPPSNPEFPKQTPWGSDFGFFSWAPEVWNPTDDPSKGSNMLDFVRSFAQRFREGV